MTYKFALSATLACMMTTGALADDAALTGMSKAQSDSQAVSVRDHVLSLRQDVKDGEFPTRIFGGRPSPDGAWPAQVSLHSAYSMDGSAQGRYSSQFCGGTIITDQWILTAAHCVVGENGYASDPDSLLVRSGDVDMRRGDMRRVAEVIVHPGYDPNVIDNDIALLKLSSRITDSSGPVTAISLQTQGEAPPKGPAVVVGWGRMENGDFPVSLMETDIDIVSNEVCNSGMAEQTRKDMGGFLLGMGEANRIPIDSLERAFAILVGDMGDALTSNMVCAGTSSGQRTMCNGDSGGPLMVQAPNGAWVQVGVVSWNRAPIGADSKCGHENLYGVYTRVSQYYDWIVSHVDG